MRLHIVEGYSGVLTDMVLAEELDFAVVPAFEGQVGLRSRLLVRDREMLLSGPRRGLTPLAPVRLQGLPAVQGRACPGRDNIRRRNLETYFQTHGVEVEAMLEMDAMIGTLEFVARSDWVTVLPSLISVNDIGGRELVVNPIVEPSLYAEFVVIEPSRRTLSAQARLFLERFEAEVAHIHRVWGEAIAPKRARGGQATRVRKVAAPRSFRVFLAAAGIGLEPRRLDAGDGADLVVVGGVARDADRADDVAVGIADQHAGGIADHAALAHRRQHGEELRRVGRAFGERARAEPHAERAPGFAEGDVEAQDSRLVLALEGDEMPAGIEHRDRERLEFLVAAGLERDVDNG